MEEEKELSHEMQVILMLQDLGKAIIAVSKQVDKLEEKVHQLGRACGESFRQTKVVVEHLTEAVDGTRQDLSEYGGTITASTWDIDPFFS